MKRFRDTLERAGLDGYAAGDGSLSVRTPIDGSEIARLPEHGPQEIGQTIRAAEVAFQSWRDIPAPRRGDLIRQFGDMLRAKKAELAELVALESGKILPEALGEVQEMIDICDLAVGLSRQLFGLTIASERPGHALRETWHPAGPCAVITAFNFPVAVFAWNAALALVCGNSIVWKPSEKTPLSALAVLRMFDALCARAPFAPPGLVQVVIGGSAAGQALADCRAMAVVSATGSTRMGRAVARRVSARLGRSILELGGNNAMIVAPSADMELAVRSIIFSAVGTCGQRCTSLRRLIVHADIYDVLLRRLKAAFASLPIGDPLASGTLVGPLIDLRARDVMLDALASAQSDGGIVTGGQPIAEMAGAYVRPAIVEMPSQTRIVLDETFAPILYVMKYRDLMDAIRLQNDVPQGLSSCIFTNDVREAEYFLSAAGSDCGIANVNIGPSGAEIGGAFGGEKDTGGGREAGSDAWKNYMRRQTSTTNYSRELPLAQGIELAFPQ